jgi:tetraacyldisaccharide 4'-kinase
MSASMDQQAAIEILSGRAKGVGPAALRAALLAASVPYGTSMRLRRWLYRRGLLPSHTAPVPVICVGNLTTGGTGKTPMVAWVVRRLEEAGRQPAILTRGYKSVDGVSDEAQLLRELTNRPVVVNGDRVAGAKGASAQGADVVVMDDGFQHLRLRRDLDVVLIDATNPFGFGRCLPRGLLREGTWALRDADAVVLTHADAVCPEAVHGFRARLKHLAPHASVHLAAHRPVRAIDGEGREQEVSALAGLSAMAFCGIGSPASFFDSLRNLGVRLAGTLALDDHVAYGREELSRVVARAREVGAEALITTCKDYVKLSDASLGLPVWRLVVEMEILDGRDELVRRLLRAAGPPAAPPGDAHCEPGAEGSRIDG